MPPASQLVSLIKMYGDCRGIAARKSTARAAGSRLGNGWESLRLRRSRRLAVGEKNARRPSLRLSREKGSAGCYSCRVIPNLSSVIPAKAGIPDGGRRVPGSANLPLLAHKGGGICRSHFSLENRDRFRFSCDLFTRLGAAIPAILRAPGYALAGIRRDRPAYTSARRRRLRTAASAPSRRRSAARI